ncbi:NAD(P)H-dependent oxidoreductase [Aquibium sp. A9E412]|uniref:NADPH-dependent FMN reductase n=1 Tax=Aquibium sp. A9E412 TaxID=2976767 RepID=UPI0025AEF567|nr:NAD(P)H-dependent oxidoreductase [Aquibium sp. A9E412]MDN2566294.1 NAD(P)H-dependent oxidoreductase [Aquibium sp. A9E412]
MPDRARIVGISGSLRQGSFNTAALHAAREMAADRLDIDVVRLNGLPLFDADVEARGWPGPVAALRERVAAADGVIFAVPEYNYSMTGVLKNAIDWLSRPEGAAPLNGKPATMLGATPSKIGTARAQAHLRDVVFYNAMPLLPYGEVLIMDADDKFDADGRLTDETSRKFLGDLLDKFADWVAATAGTGG